MDTKGLVKEYIISELTMVWKPKTCICTKTFVYALPHVYSATENPCLKIEIAATQEFKYQIHQCPFGVLISLPSFNY